MAKGNDAGDSYKPIKNQELLKGSPDTRSIEQRVDDGKKAEARKPDETFKDLARRTMNNQNKSAFSDLIKGERQPEREPSKDPNKDK